MDTTHATSRCTSIPLQFATTSTGVHVRLFPRVAGKMWDDGSHCSDDVKVKDQDNCPCGGRGSFMHGLRTDSTLRVPDVLEIRDNEVRAEEHISHIPTWT